LRSMEGRDAGRGDAYEGLSLVPIFYSLVCFYSNTFYDSSPSVTLLLSHTFFLSLFLLTITIFMPCVVALPSRTSR